MINLSKSRRSACPCCQMKRAIFANNLAFGDTAIVVIALTALLAVAYQGGYILSNDDSTSTSVNEITNETEQSNSLDEIHPLASTCLSHGELTRHDHMYLTIQIEEQFVTISENVGVNSDVCNESGANMHVVHTHSSDGKLHLEMQTQVLTARVSDLQGRPQCKRRTARKP